MRPFCHRSTLFLLAAIVLSSAGCGRPKRKTPTGATADDARRRTVVFDIDSGRQVSPDLWNPFVPGAQRVHGFHQCMIEPLFILNYETGEIEPWLGESMTANDSLDEWILKLRPGIKWNDGEAFDANDVVLTVNMLIEHSPELLDSARLATWVKQTKMTDPLTVRFVLTKPNPRFQLDFWSVKIFGSTPIVPEHIWANKDPLTFKNYDPEKGWPVFTGPYRLERIGNTAFSYVRDDNWWGAQTGWKPLPAPEILKWIWYGPEETRTASMAGGKLDSLMDISLGAFLAMRHRNPRVIAWKAQLPHAWLDPCPRSLEFNHTVEPWNDKTMRWAVNHAIDRSQIVTVAYERTTYASRHFFPAYAPLNRYVELLEKAGLYERYPIGKHDPSLAKKMLESRGYQLNRNGYYEKDGKELSLIITTHEAFIEKQRIAQVVVEQLQRVGINACTRNEASGTWSDNYQFGRFEARMGWQSGGSVNEPWASMDTFNARWVMPVGERAQYNGWRWNNPGYSEAVDRIGTLPLNAPEIDDLFVRAMEIWLAELPLIPITQAKKLIPFDTTYWTGWPSAENNYMHPPAWWQSAHKIIHNLKPAGQGR